jgi:uncharacterized membrane protein
MKENKWLKEIPLMILMGSPLLVYAYLKPLLPEQLASHYTTNSQGKWIADSYMSPLGLVITMFIGCLISYVSTSFPLLSRWQWPLLQQQFTIIVPFLYALKAGLVLLLSAIPIYQMLVAAGKLTAGSGAVWSYAGGIGLLVLLHLFIYRLYAVMYRRSEEKPLARKPYVIIWVATHVVVSIGPLCSLLAATAMNAHTLMTQFILVFLAVCGNLMYNVRPNPYLGIRTPWTLKNDTVWRKTHRMGGILLFVFGVMGFIGTFLVNEKRELYILLLVLQIVALVPAVYSYIIYKKITHTP